MGAHGRASAVAFLTLTALLASAIGPAAAIIKQTQLGEADWISQHVGKVARAEFAAGGRPRVYAATESNVVACLNLRDGSIVWRQVGHQCPAITTFIACIAVLATYSHDSWLLVFSWERVLAMPC